MVLCFVTTECCMQMYLVHDQPPTQILGTQNAACSWYVR